MTQPAYVFIVGLPRTGTTLMRQILNDSENVAICGETHFLGGAGTVPTLWRNILGSPISLSEKQAVQGFRKEFAELGDLSTDSGAQEIVDRIFNINYSFWSWIRKNVDREEFLEKLLASDRTDRALFDLIMAFYANGKPVRGEKTPAHIHYVPTLLDWFPKAKVIHMFRDPRAIYISQKKKLGVYIKKSKWIPSRYQIIGKSKSVSEIVSGFYIINLWLRVARLNHLYQQLYPDNYYLCKYEDLISAPVPHLKKICNFLGIDFEEAMLQRTVVNSSFIQDQQPTSGFDIAAVDRWRNYMHPLTSQWFGFWCKKQLREFGYQL